MSEPRETYTLKRVGEYVAKPEEWVTHRRSKNYIAEIVGLDPNYGFERYFLERVRVGRRTYFKLEDFEVGNFYEIFCAYYTRSGKEQVHLHVFLRLKEIKEDELVFEVVSEEDIIKYFEQRVPEEVVEEAKKEIEEPTPTLSEEEARELKEALLAKIREIGDLILSLAGGTDRVEFSWTEKTDDREVQHEAVVGKGFIKVDGEYVWSDAGVRATIGQLLSGLKLLKKGLKEYEKRAERILEEAKKELAEDVSVALDPAELESLRKRVLEKIEEIGEQLLVLAGTERLDYEFKTTLPNIGERKIEVSVNSKYIRYRITGLTSWTYLKSEYGVKEGLGGLLFGLRIMREALKSYMELQQERLAKAEELLKTEGSLEELAERLRILRQELKERIKALAEQFIDLLGNGESYKDDSVVIVRKNGIKIKWKGEWFGYGEKYLSFYLRLYEFLKKHYEERAKEALKK